jgi:HprK-related kinase A
MARGDGLLLHTGPFNVRLRSDEPQLIQTLQQLYQYHRLADPQAELIDFTLNLLRPRGIRRWWRPQVVLHTDAHTPFEPFRLDHAFPLFEWSLNWVIAMQAHQFLMLHSAVVEKDGVALIMPALPGSGKSTLCAALMLRGWRLLSDEFGLIRAQDPDTLLHPLPRPVPLKNQSIEVIRQFSEQAVLGPTFPATRKGDVAHLMASRESQLHAGKTAVPGWFLFPRYQQDQAMHLEQLGRGTAFLKVSSNCFNYKLQGARGFRAIASLVDRCPAFFLRYSDLDAAIEQIERFHAGLISNRAPAAPAAR